MGDYDQAFSGGSLRALGAAAPTPPGRGWLPSQSATNGQQGISTGTDWADAICDFREGEC